MGVYKKYLYSFPDSAEFYDSNLAYSEILLIERRTMQYDEVEGSPVGYQCQYEYSTGFFRFDPLIFTGVPLGRFVPDKILVIYKQ